MAEYVIEQIPDLDSAWPEVEPLVEQLIEYHRPWDQRSLRFDWAERMREHMRGRTTLLARAADGHAFGFVSGGVTDEQGIFDEVIGYIDNIYIEDAWRHSGVGREMVRRFESFCREGGASEIRLDVTSGNKAGMRFWVLSGFEMQAMTMRRTLERPS